MKHIAKKKFGQNFLVDQAIINSLIQAINPQADDLMVEIGPGLGAMTQPLIKQLTHLHVVEIDRDIIAWMQGFYPKEKVTIHNADVLKFDFSTISLSPISSKSAMSARRQEVSNEKTSVSVKANLPCKLSNAAEAIVHVVQRGADDAANNAGALNLKKLRVVGNLPYNISSPILFKLLENASQIIDMHFMLQKEVVERMVAAPSSSEYGRLSVMLQYALQMEYLITVPPDAFDPAPKVESAFVRCVPFQTKPYVADDEKLFAAIVQAAFGQRRKTLRNTLKNYLNDEDFKILAIDSQLRAENLHVSDYVRIANLLTKQHVHMPT